MQDKKTIKPQRLNRIRRHEDAITPRKYSHAAISCTPWDVLGWQRLPVSSVVNALALGPLRRREQSAEIALKFPISMKPFARVTTSARKNLGPWFTLGPSAGRGGGCGRYKFGPLSMFQLMSQKAYHRGFLRP
jgi:hypothetical protein